MPTLSFQNITVSVPDVKGPKRYLPSACLSNQHRKEVLHDVSGRFPNKGIVAIMGPSGSGKTTFLNAVSNRMAIGGSSGVKCSGMVKIDGQTVPPEFFYSKSVSFVPQDTCLFAELTPRESIRFSTTLIFPTLSPDAVEIKVNKTLAAMGLQKCADTQIGNEMFRGVSGGERKRTSIGVNIVNEPSVLFLDEPTTGLDTETAALVVRSIQNLSTPSPAADPKAAAAAATPDGDGRIIIMTLHQPSSDIWEMIDHLVILAQGYIVYNGPACDAMDFFVSIGFKRPAHVNPADFFLDIVQCEEDPDEPHAAAASASAAERAGNAAAGSGAAGSAGGIPSNRSGRHPSSLPRLNVPSAPPVPEAGGAGVNPAAAAVARTRSSKKLRAKFLATAWRHHERITAQARRLAAATSSSSSGTAVTSSAGATAAVGWAPAPLRTVGSSGSGGREGRKAKLEEALRRYNERMQQQQLVGDGNEEGDALGSDVEDSQSSIGGGDYDDDIYPVTGFTNVTSGGFTSGSGSGGVLQAYRNGSHGHGQGTLKGTAKWIHELKALTSRSWKTFVRTRLMIPMKMVQICITAVLIIGLFTPLGNDQISVLNRTGCMYLVIIVQIFATVLSVVMLFPAERGVYLNEQAQRLYSVSSYFVSKLLIDIPILTATIFGFCLLVYFPVGFQPTFSAFMRFFFVLECVAICGHATGLIVASAVESPAVAALLAPMCVAPFILFSHIAIPGNPDRKIIGILRPFQIFSPFWWGLDALAATEFSGLRLYCTDEQVYAVPSIQHGLMHLCRFVLGEEVLMSYAISPNAFGEAIGLLITLACINLGASCGLLKFLSMRVAKCVPMEPPQNRVSLRARPLTATASGVGDVGISVGGGYAVAAPRTLPGGGGVMVGGKVQASATAAAAAGASASLEAGGESASGYSEGSGSTLRSPSAHV